MSRMILIQAILLSLFLTIFQGQNMHKNALFILLKNYQTPFPPAVVRPQTPNGLRRLGSSIPGPRHNSPRIENSWLRHCKYCCMQFKNFTSRIIFTAFLKLLIFYFLVGLLP